MCGGAPRLTRSIAPLSCPAPGWTTLAVAGMSLVGTLAGTFGGILVANKLTTYRIEQLERKVSEHNKVVERTYKLEGRMTEAEHDIRDLKGAA